MDTEQADGTPYLKVLRYEPDGFEHQHWTGAQWEWGKPAGAPIPYRLPEMLAAKDARVFIVGSEQDVDNLAKLGCIGTTAGAPWDPALGKWFKDRHAVIVPSADKAGHKHAMEVVQALLEITASIKLLDLFPGKTDGSSISDWLAHDTLRTILAITQDRNVKITAVFDELSDPIFDDLLTPPKITDRGTLNSALNIAVSKKKLAQGAMGKINSLMREERDRLQAALSTESNLDERHRTCPLYTPS